MKKLGQIGIFPLFGIGATILIASIGAFFSQSNRIGGVETKAAVLETKYESINEKLEKMDGKLDAILLGDKYKLGGIATSSKINGH